MSDHHQPTNRVSNVARWSVAGLILCFIFVLARIIQLETSPGQRLAQFAPRTESSRTEPAVRGDILDRRGRVLATTRIGRRLFADPSLIEDSYNLATLIASRFHVNPIEVDKRLQPRLNSRYVVLIPLLTDDQVATFRAMPTVRGLGLEDVPVRVRPFGDVGASFIGKVGVDQSGLSGMERVLNDALTGNAGRLRYLRDVQRRAMWIEPVGYQAAEDGETLRLSIDVEIQRIAEEELTAAVDHYEAGGGRVIVLDPSTGELLAMCNVVRNRAGRDSFATDPGKAIDPALGRLRCVSDPYEPGSTFKPFVWAAATELNVVKPKEILNTHNGLYRTSKGRRIRDSHGHDKLDWETILIKSSNIGMSQAAERMSDRQMRDAINRFGFGRITGCGLPGETAGIVTSAKNWTHYSQTSVSFGQEIAVTPIQMVRAFSAFAKDGTLPTIRTFAVEKDFISGELIRSQAWVEQRAVAESIALQTRYVLRRVMTEGTGRYANKNAKYRMFAKSGTPQMPNRTEGGYYQDRYLPNFIAGAPLEKPRLVVLCVIEDPDRSIGHFGGIVAGPVVVNVMNRALEYLGVASDLGRDFDNRN